MTEKTGVFIGWNQTADERYDTDVNAQARKLIEEVGTVVEYEGGCWLDETVALPAEEFYMLDGVDYVDLIILRARLSEILGNPETLRIEAEGKTGVNIA